MTIDVEGRGKTPIPGGGKGKEGEEEDANTPYCPCPMPTRRLAYQTCSRREEGRWKTPKREEKEEKGGGDDIEKRGLSIPLRVLSIRCGFYANLANNIWKGGRVSAGGEGGGEGGGKEKDSLAAWPMSVCPPPFQYKLYDPPTPAWRTGPRTGERGGLQ